MRFRFLVCVVSLFSLFFICPLVVPAQNTTSMGSVYVMTNRAEGNSVLIYSRAANGSLTLSKEVPTKGLGTGFTGDPFESQGSLTLSTDGKLLFAVNPGSGDLTAFVVGANGLTFGSRVSSQGAFPVSVTEFGGVVYVLNQLRVANIAGFAVNATGHLQYISGSKKNLAGGSLAQPAQVRYTPDGKQLLVTEKGTDMIDIFDVQGNGMTSAPKTVKSSGHTPFGFAFDASDNVVVTDAERRIPMAATASSYHVLSGDVSFQTPAVKNDQTGACWVAITGHTAWVVNTGTATITAYDVDSSGALTVANAVAASTGAMTTPIDLAASSDGRFIYVLESGTGALAGFRVSGTSLAPIFTKAGLPLSIQGIAVR